MLWIQQLMADAPLTISAGRVICNPLRNFRYRFGTDTIGNLWRESRNRYQRTCSLTQCLSRQYQLMNPCMQNCWLRPWEWNLDGSVNGSTRQDITPTFRNGTRAAESLWTNSQATLQKWASSMNTVHTSSAQSCGPARLQLSIGLAL